MKFTSRLLALLGSSLLVALPGAHAQQPGSPMYAVELIVFRVTSPSGNEDMSAVPPGRGFGNESTRGGGTPQVLRILPAADYRLAGVDNTLRGSGAWRPIAHAAWIQTAANWGTHVGIALGELGINTPGLSGMVFLERATYLHLGLELTLNSGGINYTIKEMRSVKYNERQYFDHPAFGVIAVVSPVNANSAAGAAAH
ncbi:MAG TPA: hypothetical protein VGL50_05710 [Steroidobacteraceae bacterium]|jgi:hypothetical protein